ncbi:hypothetical protein AB5J62_29230 [Amycolatopsis sp. cg5]|uniref:hypothetical protein n=1 Tax=Amycolatopsis sp. cg5 TaxID=3238802 RepID=UPI003525E981
MGKMWLGAAAVLLVAGCSSTPEAPKVFGPTAYGKLTLGMTAEAALATGELAKEPTSRLDGCADYSLTGGPAPDPARMAAQAAAEKDLEEAAAKNGHSAAESAAVAQAAADSAMAAVPRAEQREIRDKAMGVSGGVSIGKSGLVTLAAPAGAKTPEGVAQGSTVDELKKAYGARVTEKNGEFSAPIPEKDGFVYRFLTEGGKVTGVFVTTPKISCE